MTQGPTRKGNSGIVKYILHSVKHKPSRGIKGHALPFLQPRLSTLKLNVRPILAIFDAFVLISSFVSNTSMKLYSFDVLQILDYVFIMILII